MKASPRIARSWSSRGSQSASEAARVSIAHSVVPLNASICRPRAIRRISTTMSLTTNSSSSMPWPGITNRSPVAGDHVSPASRSAAASCREITPPVCGILPQVARWTCEHCGATGDVAEAELGDTVLCDVCAEPVIADEPGPGADAVATVREIRRFPVKAMGGESLTSVEVDSRGLVGDRAYAVVDGDGKLASGKHSKRFRRRDGVFEFAAGTTPDGVVVTGLGGEWSVSGEDLDRALSDVMGDPVRVLAEATTPYFDAGHVSLVGSASLDWCRRNLDVDADRRRIRPNLVVETDEPFVEETWAELAVGEVRLAGGRGIQGRRGDGNRPGGGAAR